MKSINFFDWFWLFRSFNLHKSHLFPSFNQQLVKLNRKENENRSKTDWNWSKSIIKRSKIDQNQNWQYDFDYKSELLVNYHPNLDGLESKSSILDP